MCSETLQDLDTRDGDCRGRSDAPVAVARSGAAGAPSLSRPGLLVMDVDSTLIDEEVIDELGAAAGCGERIAAVTERAMRGELDFAEALRARVALLEGLPDSIFAQVHDALHFTTGALDLIGVLHAHGWKVGVVSGGFHEVVDMLAADAKLDHWIANRLEVKNGRLTGRVLGEIVTKDVKLRSLRAWAEELGVPMAQTVAVGDGANDIPMIRASGLGVAFCAKPKTRAAAPHAINTRDLRLVLDLLRP
ncbi:phosphoserine phosphatase [Bifidobacterium biavatii DSM 23969]|uniref:phosphoserine phosphatase n=2 Tax=Bifidobacterium biavatii TaxID=762212 RepID=A0A087A1X7_9BIFI|nr:phosphoserine phosphatase [Bifidobacterium biavatii DSM 23969]